MRPRQLLSGMGGYSLPTWYIVISMICLSRGQNNRPIPANPKITRLESDQKLGDFVISNSRNVYVGGTNVLYHLDGNLKVLESLKTGPQMDSTRCHASGESCGHVSKQLTDNFNKALVVDEENEKLIVCGSVRQGSCSKYQLSNISSQVEFLPVHVAANEAEASTFAFIGKFCVSKTVFMSGAV